MTSIIPGWVLLLSSLLYMGGLFAVAWWGDRTKLYPENLKLRPIIYSLALAVYGSSWTFYGAVGTAARDGIFYIAGYLGPLILLVFGLWFFERLVRIAKQQNATSISDFLAGRFGRSRRIGVIVTVIALTAIPPYIALQLTAISMSIEVLTGQPPGASLAVHWYEDSTLLVALMLAVFAILFGTRVVDASEHHPGMVLAIAAESLFKLLALIAVAIFALTTFDDAAPLRETVARMPELLTHPSMFIAHVVVTLFAMFCLPRQFHVGIVECADVADVRRARWWFGGYLVLLTLVVVPIVATSFTAGATSAANADSLVLLLPMSEGQTWLALFAYLGGFSAATGMVIVASIALSTMISNELLLPAMFRFGLRRRPDRVASPALILWIRRIAIVGLLLWSYAFFRLTPSAPSLASLGSIPLVAVAQFAPAIIAAVLWPGASRAGVVGGLCAGFLVWLYTLLIPAVVANGADTPAWVSAGPFGIGWLAPGSLFGIRFPESLSNGVFWTLSANVALLVTLSLRYRPAIRERLTTVNPLSPELPHSRAQLLPGGATVGDLRLLAERLLGASAAGRLLERRSRELRRPVLVDERADVALLQSLERDLAGALGAASARLVLTSALRGAGPGLAEIVTMFDEATRKLRFNRDLLETMMDNMPQGVSVVNADMQLVAWNQRYLDLFEYPAGFVHAGRSVAELIRLNAERGWCGPGDPDEHVRRRLEHMRAGTQHFSERRRPDGRVIELRGQPLPDGGFVTTFSDVTSHKRNEESLREINETLEQRVDERTRQLSEATALAEQANLSKTRFVVAASHDLLQPLGAARLFNAALRSRAGSDSEVARLSERVENSLSAAGELLDGLLDISRLDAGGVRADISVFAVMDLLSSLQEQFGPLAAQRGLVLKVAPTGLHVRSDRHLLRRVLQNFVGNALRYTSRGTVLLGCRRRGDAVEVQVIDTGPGISAEHRQSIFEEFRRLDLQSPWGEKGLGLGLSICDRIATILGVTLTLESRPQHGSIFGIRVARAPDELAATPEESQPLPIPLPVPTTARVRILCIDDDAATLAAMRELLTRWEFEVVVASSPEQALRAGAKETFDVVLADYHLHGQPAGLELLEQLARARGGALLTAGATDKLIAQAGALGFPVLRKPVRPAALRALIAALVARGANQFSSSGASGAN
jgi:Na+/proline symporter/signal transduction histidine kinase/CheY-like chemotaxis protein